LHLTFFILAKCEWNKFIKYVLKVLKHCVRICIVAEYFVSWWNLENLFDLEDSKTRPAWLQKHLANELKGWNSKILDKKIAQLASIIKKMNNGAGPDILGVCEVENESVVQRLVDSLDSLQRDYYIVHEDTEDKRGIDVAIIFDEDKFNFEKKFSHVVLKRESTRDIFQVNLKIQKTKQDLIIVGNHWPSRMGGELDSEPYRMTAGETLSYWHQRILEEKEKEGIKNAPILVMGDFNDEPHNRSITHYALATNSLEQVLNPRVRNPLLYNLMWNLMASGQGTHFGTEFSMLDQFMVSKGLLLTDSRIKVKLDSTNIIKFPEMIKTGYYQAPLRFGRPAKDGMNKKGFSDHFPISIILEEN